MNIRNLCVISFALACGTAMAQDRPRPASPAGTVSQPAAAGDAAARRERILKATELPTKAREVRAKGVPDADVKEAMRAAKSKGVKAGEMADVTGEQSKAIDEHGRIDNFGSFVRSKLDEGLRGRELAAAIREEHARRGIGKGNAKGKAPGAKSEEKERPREKPTKAPEADDAARPDKAPPAGGGRGKGGGAGGGHGKGKGKP